MLDAFEKTRVLGQSDSDKSNCPWLAQKRMKGVDGGWGVIETAKAWQWDLTDEQRYSTEFIFSPLQRVATISCTPTSLQLKFPRPALVTHLDGPSALNNVFTCYQCCAWYDIICTTGRKKHLEKLIYYSNVHCCQILIYCIFLTSFPELLFRPPPSSTVTRNGNHSSIYFTCTCPQSDRMTAQDPLI